MEGAGVGGTLVAVGAMVAVGGIDVVAVKVGEDVAVIATWVGKSVEVAVAV